MIKFLASISIFLSGALFATTPHAYITEVNGTAVSIIDINRNTIQKIYGFNNPNVVKVTRDGTAAYVSDAGNILYKIDCQTNIVYPLLTLGGHPVAISILPNGSVLYTANSNGTLSIVDLVNKQIIDELSILSGPQDIKITPDGRYAYVTNKENGTITVLSTSDNSVVRTITGLISPVGITIDPDGKKAYVTDTANDTVYLINISDNALEDTIYGFNQPKYVVISPSKSYAFVSNYGNNTVTVLRTSDNYIVTTISVPQPSALGVSPDNNYLLVGSDDDEVFKINLFDFTVSYVFSTFNGPCNIAVSDNNSSCETVNGWQVVTPTTVFNQVTWSQPAGKVVQYRIFQDSASPKLLAVIPGSTCKLIYNHTDILPAQTYTYSVVADYATGFSTSLGNVKVSNYRQGLPR